MTNHQSQIANDYTDMTASDADWSTALVTIRAGTSGGSSLVTSAPRSLAEARMGVAGLPLPPVQVMAEDVRASKPDPEGFLRAATLLGVDPASCVVLEDSAAGIAAARAAGMAVVGVGDAAASCDPDIAVVDLTMLEIEASPGGTVTLTRI